MIEISNLEVTFNRGTASEARAIRNISAMVQDHEFVTVIGSNGAGKSTLLSAIAGEVRPSGGYISINGKDVSAIGVKERSALCARVFQDPRVGSCGKLTIEENLALADDRGKNRDLQFALTRRRRARYRDMLSTLGLGLEDRLDERMELLSGGQRQAISLLMATMRPSEILLLDEMTAALDPRMAQYVMDLTRSIVERERLTVLMVTHSMVQALDYGTRTLMLHRGSIILDVCGEERERLGVDDLVARFGKLTAEKFDQDSLLLG